MKMEPIGGSETSAFSTQTPGRYPKENALHIEHGKSLKSWRMLFWTVSVGAIMHACMPLVKDFISFCYFVWRYFVNRLFHSRDRQWHNLHIYFNMHKLRSDMSFLTFLLGCILPVCTWDMNMCKYLYTAWWPYKPASYLFKVNSGVTLVWKLLV